MNGREEKTLNDLFFLCSLIEYVARGTKNRRAAVVDAMGAAGLAHFYDLADVYHAENLDQVRDELVAEYAIHEGSFDNVADCAGPAPTHWDLGKVYKRLIADVAAREGRTVLDALHAVYHSPLTEKLDDYNCSAYYENPGYLYASYREGKMV
jgi:hypothetical protein